MQKEEECDPGQVCDGLLYWGSSLGCRIKKVEDGDLVGVDSRGGGVFMSIGRKLLSQPKVEAYHGVESWIFGPHCRKYFPHGAEVLLHASLLNGRSVCCEDP